MEVGVLLSGISSLLYRLIGNDLFCSCGKKVDCFDQNITDCNTSCENKLRSYVASDKLDIMVYIFFISETRIHCITMYGNLIIVFVRVNRFHWLLAKFCIV